MIRTIDISEQLAYERSKARRRREEELLSEARRILNNDLFSGAKVLHHLDQYKKRSERLDEEEIASEEIYTVSEIRAIATRFRLKLLDDKFYKPEVPFEAELKKESLNRNFKKDLKNYCVLSYPVAFENKTDTSPALLFARTNHDNYYLVHRWGRKLPYIRQFMYWPLRNFENLLATVILFTLLVTLVLPTNLITLDSKATYWCGYRAAAFMHLLIFNAGVTTYITFAFTRSFSSSVWNRKQDFG